MKRILFTVGFAFLGLTTASAGDKVWNNYPESRAEIAQLRTTAFAVGIDTSRKGEVAWLKSCLSGVDFATGGAARGAPETRGAARGAPETGGAARGAPETGVRRVGVVNWDCSVPSTTYFGKATCNTLGPAKWRDRTPYYAEVLGPDRIEHHDRTLAEYETEMQYAIDAGIDYFAYCWYDLNPPPGDKSKCAGKLQEITRARRLHVKSALRNRLSLCAILVTSHPYSDECLKDLAAEMRNPWYEKANGRPLVYMFSSTSKVTPRLREICRAAGAGDPYVVAMITEPPANCTNSFVHADALCCYACTEEGPEPEAYADMAVQWNAIRATAGLPVVPQFATGWDPRPRMERPVPWAWYPDKPWAGKLSAEVWLDQAVKLRTWIARNPKACPTGHVMAFAWNEFEEGGWICPNVGKDGRPDTTRVRTFRQVVETLKAPSPDADKALGRHGYFTDEALKAADVRGLADDIAHALARSDRAFELAAKTAAQLAGHDRIALERRMEIAHRLKRYVAKRASAPERDELILAWQGAKDLELLYDYFAKEAKRRELSTGEAAAKQSLESCAPETGMRRPNSAGRRHSCRLPNLVKRRPPLFRGHLDDGVLLDEVRLRGIGMGDELHGVAGRERGRADEVDRAAFRVNGAGELDLALVLAVHEHVEHDVPGARLVDRVAQRAVEVLARDAQVDVVAHGLQRVEGHGAFYMAAYGVQHVQHCVVAKVVQLLCLVEIQQPHLLVKVETQHHPVRVWQFIVTTSCDHRFHLPHDVVWRRRVAVARYHATDDEVGVEVALHDVRREVVEDASVESQMSSYFDRLEDEGEGH